MAVNESLRAVTVFVQELWKAGVQHVCISPGSRSTPLTMAIARDGRYQIWSLLDERSAGFFAVGLARKTGQPVALVCTSGTATGNYLPAVMEAHEARLPLVVLTADRPPELHHVGSNQTVDQLKMYGTFSKWSVNMPVPETLDHVIRHAASTAWRAATVATASPAGPVHVNWPFREPLIPPSIDEDGGAWKDVTFVRNIYESVREPSEAALDAVTDLMSQAKRPMMVCGPMDVPQFAEAVTELATQWGAPILADPLSQLRTGPHDKACVIDTYDTFLRVSGLAEDIQPDLIVRFGQPPTSKVLGQFLAQKGHVRQIVVDSGDLWRDPFHTATDVIQSNPERFCRRISRCLMGRAEVAWLEAWQEMNHRMQHVIRNVLNGDDWFEGRVFLELNHLLPDDTTLFTGNSMPVRDLDAFYLNHDRSVHVLANRGVSGIDGVVSSALGASAGATGPVVLVIGDVSFYHDLNGLLSAMRHDLNLVVVLIHNDGGGIFSFLPQAAHPDTFEHFQTSHGLDFRAAVEMYGGHFHHVETWNSFREAMTDSLEHDGLHVVELRTDGQENVQLHRNIFAAAEMAMEGHVWRASKLR